MKDSVFLNHAYLLLHAGTPRPVMLKNIKDSSEKGILFFENPGLRTAFKEGLYASDQYQLQKFEWNDIQIIIRDAEEKGIFSFLVTNNAEGDVAFGRLTNPSSESKYELGEA